MHRSSNHHPTFLHHPPSFRRRKFPLVSSAVDFPSRNAAFFRRFRFLLLFFVVFFFVYNLARFFRFSSDVSGSSFAGAVDFVFPLKNTVFSQDNEEYRLEQVLKNAATRDKTVIITTLNEAWAAPRSIIDLFLESFRIGLHTQALLNHLVIVTLDDRAYRRCLTLHQHCVVLVTDGVDFSKEANFMKPDYLQMMWKRIDFLRRVLEMGYSFVFSDADIMWLRNPFPYFDPDTDFQIACDHFTGNPFDLENSPNGGFNYVKSNNRTIEFYKYWHSSREKFPGYHDQDVLNFIKHSPYIDEIGLTMRFLDTAYFGGFCESSKDFNEVCTMHANCCIGMDSKVFDLGILLQDWRLFMSLPPSLQQTQRYSWRVPQKCRFNMFFAVNTPKESEAPHTI
ncbi:hypothetical protein RND81_11G202600 [Saponaria officinalis]|uniref:Glycosyltransferase n=1 Tax=Saponaria officinalis TaxID=3572 RepID=A0AAW1HPK4_SAPOF